MKWISLLILPFLLGCSLLPKGRIKSGGTTVTAVKDAGKPATLSTGETKTSIAIPEGTPVSITKIESTPATATTPAQPAREVVQFTPTQDTRFEAVSSSLQADTGTIDTTVALKKVQAAEARVLLYAALVSAIGVGVFMWLKYPTPALICGAASIVFFLAWKVSDLPSWFYVIGVAGLAGAVFLWLGHERGEKFTKTPARIDA